MTNSGARGFLPGRLGPLVVAVCGNCAGGHCGLFSGVVLPRWGCVAQRSGGGESSGFKPPAVAPDRG